MNMKTFEAKNEQKHIFSTEDLNDLVVTALEGGINYWCGSAKIKKDTDGTFFGVASEDQDKVVYASDVVGYGGVLILTDAEDPSEKWELDAENMVKGIEMHCQKVGMPLSELMDNYDASDADCIVQFACMGEITFG